MGKRWPFLLLLLIGVAGFTAVWYRASPAPRQAQKPALGGSYVEGVAGRSLRLNPLFDQENEVDAGIDALVFAGLTRLDDRGSPYPDLAERWEISADGLTYTFHLRSGLLWQDGFPITAADAAFTYNLVTAAGNIARPPLADVLAGATIAATDPQSLRIDLPKPFAGLPAYLGLGLLPSHLLVATTAASLYTSPFNQHPVGSGPFRVEEVGEDHAVLVANPAYHFGQPYIQRLEFRFYPDDGALMVALRSGAVDGAYFSTGLSTHDLALAQGSPQLKVTPLPSAELTSLDFNLESIQLGDLRVRQALVYAIDRSNLVAGRLDDAPGVADSLLPPATWAYSPTFNRYHSDPALAAALLDDAGWRLGGGAARAQNGLPLALRLVTLDDPVRSAIAKDVARRWQGLGIQVSLVTAPATTLTRDIIPSRHFDVILFSDTAGPDPDPSARWQSSGRGPKGKNLTGFSNARADKLLEAGRAGTSPAERTAIYRDLQDLLATELPAFPLYTSTEVYVQRTNVLGQRLGYGGTPGARFWQVQDWYVKLR